MNLTIKVVVFILLGVAAFFLYTQVFAPFVQTGKKNVRYFYGNVSEQAR